LIDALQIDLVGPKPSDFERVEEILYQPPSMWYLTGFLVPYEASIEQRSDDAGDEELDRASGSGVGDDENTPEAASARKAFFPSSMGLSFLVNRNTPKLTVMVQWGDYSPIPEEKDEKGESVLQSRTSGSWKRTPCEAELEIPLDTS
ncbi:MAG: helicase, partial [Richelia sp. RM1_1_1]|nr:helicase [Richelia sp. RM1_1_1]